MRNFQMKFPNVVDAINFLHATFVARGETNHELSAQRVKFVSEQVSAFSVNQKFHTERIPERNADKGWNMSSLNRHAEHVYDAIIRLAARQMENNQRERPYITMDYISMDLRHGAGRARRRTFRESLLKRLSWFESSRLRFFALRSHLRHSRSREKEERTEQFRSIDIYEREKWSGKEEASRTSWTSKRKKHAGRFC